jgi:RNA polymerase sigma-70 factor (ECF subfamily)
MPEVENEKAWLYRLAHNRAIDHLRRSETRREHARASRAIAESTGPGNAGSDPDRAELARQLDAAVALLPPDQGIPLNTATSRFRYALENLRNHLKPLYEELK